MPEPRSKSVTITESVDASHASDKRTIRSHTGYVIFVNISSIVFYNKQQSTVESIIFSIKFIAMNTCM